MSSQRLTKSELQRIEDIKHGINLAVGYLSYKISPEQARECISTLEANFDVSPRLFIPSPKTL